MTVNAEPPAQTPTAAETAAQEAAMPDDWPAPVTFAEWRRLLAVEAAARAWTEANAAGYAAAEAPGITDGAAWERLDKAAFTAEIALHAALAARPEGETR